MTHDITDPLTTTQGIGGDGQRRRRVHAAGRPRQNVALGPLQQRAPLHLRADALLLLQLQPDPVAVQRPVSGRSGTAPPHTTTGRHGNHNTRPTYLCQCLVLRQSPDTRAARTKIKENKKKVVRKTMGLMASAPSSVCFRNRGT